MPRSSTATQRLMLGQETPCRELLSTLAAFQAAAPPVGLVDASTLPSRPTATHRSRLGQETLDTVVEVFTWVTFQAPAPPVGSLEATTLPLSSTATQRLLLGQDTPER